MKIKFVNTIGETIERDKKGMLDYIEYLEEEKACMRKEGEKNNVQKDIDLAKKKLAELEMSQKWDRLLTPKTRRACPSFFFINLMRY